MALKSVLLLLAAVALVESALPSVIRIAAVFDDDQDAKHELAFRYITPSMVDMGHSIRDLLTCSLLYVQGGPSA